MLLISVTVLLVAGALDQPEQQPRNGEADDSPAVAQSTPEPTREPTPRTTVESATENGTGADTETRPETIQEMIDQAAPGSTVMVPAEVYRETVIIDKPITLTAEPGAEIRGSDVWEDWSPAGNQWFSEDTVSEFDSDYGRCDPPGRESCQWQEQVFVDGRPLTQVASNPASGEFAVNSERQIVLGLSPEGHTVEVTMREYWIEGESADVTVEGFTMTHAASRAQEGAINNGGFNNWLIRDNALSHAHGANVSLEDADNLRLIGNDISFGGQLGVHGSEASNIHVSNNRIFENHQESYDTGWEAGGLKFAVTTNVVFDDNEVFSNNGPGLWCDIDCDNVTFSNNNVYQNRSGGIIYEISKNARIFGNVVWENHAADQAWGWGAGIRVQNSRDTEVYDNIVAWNGDGISVISQDRDEDRWNEVVENSVHDNRIFLVVLRAEHDFALAWLEDWDGDLTAQASSNRGANNAYYVVNAGDTHEVFAWGDESYTTGELDEFNGTPGEEDGRMLTDAEKDEILTAAGVPTEPNR